MLLVVRLFLNNGYSTVGFIKDSPNHALVGRLFRNTAGRCVKMKVALCTVIRLQAPNIRQRRFVIDCDNVLFLVHLCRQATPTTAYNTVTEKDVTRRDTYINIWHCCQRSSSSNLKRLNTRFCLVHFTSSLLFKLYICWCTLLSSPTTRSSFVLHSVN